MWSIRRGVKKKVRQRKTRTFFLILPAALIFLGVYLVSSLDSKMFPAGLQAGQIIAKTRMNEAVNTATSGIVEKHGLVSENFYTIDYNVSGKLNTLSVNTMLINTLCNEIALATSKELMNLESEKIQIPYGVLSGTRVFANLGPKYTLYLMPMGEAEVDYSSSFESVGINQVNFQIWLTINSRISIINPLQSDEITIERKIPLVNTVINSEVPNVYFNSSDSIKRITD